MNRRLVLSIAVLIASDCIIADKSIKIKSFHGACPGKKKLPVVFKELSVEKNQNGKTTCTIAIDVKENIAGPIKGEIVIQRCARNGQQCITVKKNKYDNYCDTIASHSSPLAQIYQNMRPRWACPIKKGIHKITKRVLDTNFLAFMANDKGLWKIKMELFDKDDERQLSCVDADIYFE